ncbi:MAG TPA: hypothetical protein VIX18_10565 [Nitrospirota bacterium]
MRGVHGMMQDRKRKKRIFPSLSALASVFVIAEMIMQSLGSSICFTEGCKLTAQYARYGELSILLIGLATFVSLTGLSLLSRVYLAMWPGRFINIILIVALACEGFFMGYLAFQVHTLCLFCVIIFGLIVSLAFVRLLEGETAVATGFVALAAVFSMQYLILPAGVSLPLPENERLVLFYSKDCKHCSEIMNELENSKLSVSHLEVNGYSKLLKSMGIEHVPTLYVNDAYQKMFLTGKDAIRRYVNACTQAEEPAIGGGGGKGKSGRTDNRPKTDKSTPVLDFFNQHAVIPPIGESGAGDGMCRETEVCK